MEKVFSAIVTTDSNETKKVDLNKITQEIANYIEISCNHSPKIYTNKDTADAIELETGIANSFMGYKIVLVNVWGFGVITLK